MFQKEYGTLVKASNDKLSLLKNHPGGYFVSSMLAGAYVGVGVLLAFTIGGFLLGQPYAKIVMGASFSVALSLVIMAGSELFTGNNMIMTGGALRKEVTWGDLGKVWGLCYLGNWVGSIVVALLFVATGLLTEDVATSFANAAALKMTLPAGNLIARGILCNFLVCLAVWCANRATSESGKLIMIFWCILAFFTTGFEHSVANMTLLTIGLFLQGVNEAITVGGYFYNLLLVSLGNIIGGALFVALPYHIISGRDKS